MPQILFSDEVPPSKAQSSAPGYPYEWTQFENAASTMLKPVKTATRLQQHSWLLPAENTLPVLMVLSALAHRHSLSYSAILVPDGAVVLALDVKPKS